MFLLVNTDNTINWIGDEWDDRLNLGNVTKHEIEGTVSSLLGNLTIYDMEWDGSTLVQSPESIYAHSEECLNDEKTYKQRISEGMTEVQAREGLFINAPVVN